MGADIHGWIEVKQKTGNWEALLEIQPLIGRYYDLFALLFGVRNIAHFTPIAPQRGIPDDASDKVKQELKELQYHAELANSLTGSELAALLSKLDEKGLHAHDAHSHSWLSYDELENFDRASKNTELIAGSIYRNENLGEIYLNCPELFDALKELSNEYGSHNVRMIAWFDS